MAAHWMLNVPGKLKTLSDRLSATWAAKLDGLRTDYTTVRAGYLDNLANGAGKLKADVFTASGSWVCPTGVTGVFVTLQGGGAGGGGGHSGGTGGGGGGGGGLADRLFRTVTPGTTYSVTVATTAAGGAPSAAGSGGGNTIFDGVTAKGSFGGYAGSGGGSGGVWGGCVIIDGLTLANTEVTSGSTCALYCYAGGTGGQGHNITGDPGGDWNNIKGGGVSSIGGGGGASRYGNGGAGGTGGASNGSNGGVGAGGGGAAGDTYSGGTGGRGLAIIEYVT